MYGVKKKCFIERSRMGYFYIGNLGFEILRFCILVVGFGFEMFV